MNIEYKDKNMIKSTDTMLWCSYNRLTILRTVDFANISYNLLTFIGAYKMLNTCEEIGNPKTKEDILAGLSVDTGHKIIGQVFDLKIEIGKTRN